MDNDLRHAAPELLQQALALNAAVSEMTSPLDLLRLAQLLAAASAAPMALSEGRLAGFLIGFAPGADYDSPNFRWFRARLPRFAYVDRVVVAPDMRGQGIARRLYARFAALAGPVPLVCEVNVEPPNPASDAFHARLGFVEIGRGSPAPGKVVRYLHRGQNGLTTTM